MAETDSPPGLVVLVGAGAGQADLLTVAAARWLSRADVVVHDRLVDPSLLRACRHDAEMIYVGKTPGGAGPDQQWINELLVRRGRAGQTVVRLKGGDPLVFGRGGEEAQALAAAGVPYRIVPGITAAVAAAAYAGIPLTDRRCASTAALVTGHQDPARPFDAVNWRALADIDTVVFYMGVKTLGEIADRLIAAGRDPDTPAAIVARAATPHQRTLVATLRELPRRAREAGIAPPALMIVGEVVSLREKLAWFERLPLFGQTILVTRPAAQAAALSAPLAELGAAVVEAPAIEIAAAGDAGAIDACLARLGEFDVIAFTSVNGVAAFVDRCVAGGVDARALAGVTLAAVGPATAEALRARFIEPDIVPQTYTTEALADAVLAAGPVAGRRVLLARADVGSAALPRALTRAGAHVEDVAFYRTGRPAALPEEAVDAVRGRRVDWVTFTSPSAVENFLDLLAEADLQPAAALADVSLAAIGPVTAAALAARGLEAAAVADPHTVDALVGAIAGA